MAAAEPLLLDEDTVRNYWTRYREGGLEALGKDGYARVLGYLTGVFHGWHPSQHNAMPAYGWIKQGERRHAEAEAIYVICDNADYYRSALDSDYLEAFKIELVLLPRTPPNLNLIEQYWKSFKTNVRYNRYYEKFEEFREAYARFFRQPRRYLKDLRSLLAENFPIIGVSDRERKTCSRWV